LKRLIFAIAFLPNPAPAQSAAEQAGRDAYTIGAPAGEALNGFIRGWMQKGLEEGNRKRDLRRQSLDPDAPPVAEISWSKGEPQPDRACSRYRYLYKHEATEANRNAVTLHCGEAPTW
jgi:hypothetical protein